VELLPTRNVLTLREKKVMLELDVRLGSSLQARSSPEKLFER
jgi:hypothetical protein